MLTVTKRCACHANHSGTAAATHEHQGDAWRAPSAAPATQITAAQRRRPMSTRTTPGEHQVLPLPHKSQRHSGGDPSTRATPGRTIGPGGGAGVRWQPAGDGGNCSNPLRSSQPFPYGGYRRVKKHRKHAISARTAKQNAH